MYSTISDHDTGMYMGGLPRCHDLYRSHAINEITKKGWVPRAVKSQCKACAMQGIETASLVSLDEDGTTSHYCPSHEQEKQLEKKGRRIHNSSSKDKVFHSPVLQLMLSLGSIPRTPTIEPDPSEN